jgi:malonyl-CoA O-methyltransferase
VYHSKWSGARLTISEGRILSKKDLPFKERVARNFSKGAAIYDVEANLQQELAKELLGLVDDIPLEGKVVEIGCGTGFVTKGLFQKISRPLLITDLAPGMVEHVKQRFPEERATYLVADGERLSHHAPFGLIISGMTFHWFEKLEESICALFHSLVRGGKLLFSCLEEESFSEWGWACKECNAPYTGLSLPSEEKMKDIFFKLDPDAVVYKKKYTVSFGTFSAFFRHLKRIGGNASPSSLSFALLKRLLKTQHTCEISYSVLFVKMEKR